METAGVTPVQQTKAQQLELERLQTLVQSNEGKVILADAMKDPNFGKPLSERVPDEGFKMTEDGRLQIEVDGVVYTQRNKGDAFLVSNDGKILEDCFGEEPKNPSATDNPNLTRLYRDGDGKIFGIENQYGAIDYSHTSPEYYPAGKPNTSLNLSLGRPTENYIMTDNVGRVIYNYNPQLDAFAEYHSTTIQGRGRTMSDSNIVSDLNQAIQDVNLKNTTFSTKKGRQKAYEDVRTQIENAYKDNKLTGQDYENLVANLNAKAEKAGGLIVKETRYQQYVAKRAEVYETNRDLLSDKIDKVATKSDYDNMVAEINESFKSGKIDKESARVLNETLDAKGELIEGVETLSQKKAKIEKQVREIETAQRIEEVEANSQHRAELLDEYLAESGEKLPSEIGTKEYYDEALSTIDRGVKSGLIEPQKAEVLRTQAKEQLARLESESSQPATEPPVIVEESRGAESNQSANVEPKTGKKFDISTDDIPTKLSDMQEFVEKNSLNALSFKVDDNTILYSIKNDETGGVMHVQFTDGKRSNTTIVKANDLQTYIEFAEDGVTPSKVRTDFIDNGKIFTKVEDMITGQVAFEEPVVMNRKRSPAGLAIENDSPIAKRFNEGSIDIEGKFTPKEVKEGSGVKESLSELSGESQVKDTPETENHVVGENETPKFEEVETNEGLQLRHKVGDENSYEFFNPETLKWEPTTKQFVDERVARDGVKAKPVEKTIGESATGNTAEEASNIHNEEVAKAESGAITGDETPVTTEESASAGEETPVSENSETADAKPSKISMFDRLFHKNKVRLEHEVEAGTRISWEHTYKTQRDENGYVRTKTDEETNIVRQKEYFNAKGKKIKTETFDIKGKKSELTEGNVTTIYNEDGTIKTVEYPNHKNVYFKYNDNGKLIGAQFWEGHNDLHPKNWNDSEYLAEKRRTNYEYNSDKGRFELLDEKGKVVTDEKGNPVSTATFDPETRHWVEEGQYSSDLAPKTTNVSRGEGRFRIKLPERNKVPKNLRDENGKLREGVTQNDKGYIESITKDEVVTTKNYDSKGTLVSETTENLTTYYNKNGKVIYTEEKLPGDKGVKITEKTKDYDLEIIEKDGSLKIIHHTKNENGTAKGTEEFKYSEKNKVYENTSPEGNVLKTVAYDVKNHSWTIRDGEGKKLDSQNNMKESHIKRNIGIGAGVLALGGGIYGMSKLTKSDDDKDVKQPAKPTAKQTSKKTTPAPKAETKVTLDDKEGTIAEDGTLILDGKKYPKDTDGTYTIGDKKYKVEDGKLVEVVDTPDDNGETGGAAPDESPEVKGTIDGKEYIIKDGKVSLGGSELTPDENGHYKIGDDKYKIEDGKLVKVEPEEPAKTDTGTDAAQSDDSQAGGGKTGGSASGTTGSQGGGRTGGSASGTTGSQGGGRTGSSTSGTTGTTHNDTSRPVTTPRSEQSEEYRHADNTPVTRVTEPTQAQKQVANDLQNEIANIKTQEELKAFFAKAISAYNAGKITLMQLDVLKTQVENHVETLNEAIKIQNEQDAIQKPEFGLGEVTTPQEPQPKEKRDITPVERMDLTQSIRNARDRKDIEKIQQEMRQYKVFPGRKNLRRAYKAKLRAIKHQDEPQKVEKYNDKFDKRMKKIENSKVYEQDSKEILYKIDKKMWDSENFYT